MPTTPRWALRYPAGSDPADVPTSMQNLAEDLDGVAFDDQGALASRPTSTPGSPGKRGRYYFAIDEGVLYRDTGTSWVGINAAGAADGPAATPTLRSLGTGALQAAAGNDARLSDQRVPIDGSVTPQKIAAALKPSGGAGGTTEALRALGTAAGMAAAGSHASQHGPAGADPLPAPAWADVTFQNGWANSGGSLQTVQYAKDSLGFVHMRGVATAGSSSVVCALPAGFRPAAIQWFAIASSDPAQVAGSVSPAGVVSIGANPGSTIGFTGISFAP